MKKLYIFVLAMLLAACGVIHYKQDTSEKAAILDFEYNSSTKLGSAVFISRIPDYDETCKNKERVAIFSSGVPFVHDENTSGNRFKPGVVRLNINVSPNGMPYVGIGCDLNVKFIARPKERLTMRIEYTQQTDQCKISLYRGKETAFSHVNMEISRTCPKIDKDK